MHRGNLEPPNFEMNRRLADSIEYTRCARRRRAKYFREITIFFSFFFDIFFRDVSKTHRDISPCRVS